MGLGSTHAGTLFENNVAYFKPLRDRKERDGLLGVQKVSTDTA